MPSQLFSTYAPIINTLTAADVRDDDALRQRLQIAASGDFQVCYTPFDHVNQRAKVVLVGLTPGMTQLRNGVLALKQQLQLGVEAQAALSAAKRAGAFSGTIRPNLVALLDAIHLNKRLGLESCAELFERRSDLVQTASVLRNAVFYRGANYSGNPRLIRQPILRDQLLKHFAPDVALTPEALFVPLGDSVSEALLWLVEEGGLKREQILDGLPHPSGANNERIAYFLGRKPIQDLSNRTDPRKLDAARQELIGRVAVAM